VGAGAAVIVDDLPDKQQTAERLWTQLQALMKDNDEREKMRQNARRITGIQAGLKIAELLLRLGNFSLTCTGLKRII
jgi:UDP-N-acetylglucosamine:LPS N-acetylglucosamine transferase